MSLKTQKPETAEKDPIITPAPKTPEIEEKLTDDPETPEDESEEPKGEEEFLEEFDDDEDTAATIEADKALKDKVANGEVPGLKPQDAAVLQSAMVPHPLSGKPVYATNEQAMLAETFKEK